MNLKGTFSGSKRFFCCQDVLREDGETTQEVLKKKMDGACGETQGRVSFTGRIEERSGDTGRIEERRRDIGRKGGGWGGRAWAVKRHMTGWVSRDALKKGVETQDVLKEGKTQNVLKKEDRRSLWKDAGWGGLKKRGRDTGRFEEGG